MLLFLRVGKLRLHEEASIVEKEYRCPLGSTIDIYVVAGSNQLYGILYAVEKKFSTFSIYQFCLVNLVNILLLPGKSSKNKPWVEKIASTFRTHNLATSVLSYSHWESESADFDFDSELKKLSVFGNEINKVIIFAKSVGTILALQAMYQEEIKPYACIFVGTAIEWARETEKDVNLWLREYSIPTLFIQKTSDPAISFENLKKLLISSGTKDYKLLNLPGDNHEYEDIELLVSSSLEFINKLT